MSDFDRDEAFYAAINGQLARDCLAAASRLIELEHIVSARVQGRENQYGRVQAAVVGLVTLLGDVVRVEVQPGTPAAEIEQDFYEAVEADVAQSQARAERS